ncbi:MAG: flagellar motor protein MotB [Rhodocyclaceae bacterium]
MNAKADKHAAAVVKRVSRRHDGDEHGGAWKVAFADFCLALMCLFLVLWVMAARSKESIEEVKRMAEGSLLDEGVGRRMETVGGPRGSLIERQPVPTQGDTLTPKRQVTNGDVDEADDGLHLSKRRYDKPEDMNELATVVKRLTAQAGMAGNLYTEITPQGLRVMLHDTDQQGMFARGSALPSERFRALLRKMGPLFAQIENQMLILGHTDALQYADRGHSAYSNWTLSGQRAMAARLQMLDGGLRADSVLQVIGMADRAPLDAQDPRAAINRRIELMILSADQARNLAAMFGMPDASAPLMEGVDTSLPRGQAIDLLEGPGKRAAERP